MTTRSRSGFTLVEVLAVLVISILLFHAAARVADLIGRADDAARSGSDVDALQAATDRVLRSAIQEAGAGIPASPNLAGVGVRAAVAPGGAPADTLIVLRGDSFAVGVAARDCPQDAGDCVALVGDHRGRLRPGDLLLVGTRTTGLSALQITAAPAVFYAPCGADCEERLTCPVTPGAPPEITRIVGSVRQPANDSAAGPCPYPFFPDGTRCEEIEQRSSGQPRMVPECRATAPGGVFTAVRVADRTAVLGFPPPPVPLARSGAGGSPRVRAVRVRASRFWVARAAGRDSALVRQNSLDLDGTWRAPAAVAAPFLGLQVETLQEGEWVAGMGVIDLEPSDRNPNFVRVALPPPSGREPAWRFRRGHHSVAAVRVRYLFRAASPAGGESRQRDAWIVAPTENIVAGGTGDID